MDDGVRIVVVGRADEERVCELADAIRGMHIRAGDHLRLDARSNLLLEKLPRPEVEHLLLEEVPDISYTDIGGLDDQIEQIADAVELPFLHQDLFAEHQLPAPKGILLYGPPGCGKTLIAKAVANSLAKKVAETIGEGKGRSYFINIKGPELLNKYVGETERQIRLVFQRAREKSDEGWPVIVFFDEMDSMFRTRGSGISSDMESTIVPQLLAEIDGVEGLKNVIVIGATNREDLIDPAILRPGRLDVKIKIERPNADAAAAIFARYLTDEIPIAAGESIADMIDATVDEMYRDDEANRFLEVTYQNGDKEILYYKDFSSGAMIENIVRRAKKLAIKRVIGGGAKGVCTQDLLDSIKQEYKEHEDLPNTTNPDDWAKISGKKGERIVFIRTLVSETAETDVAGGRAIERVRPASTCDAAGASTTSSSTGRRASSARSCAGTWSRRHGTTASCAGRSPVVTPTKLDEVARSTGADVPRIVADAADRAALDELDGVDQGGRVDRRPVRAVRIRTRRRPSSRPAIDYCDLTGEVQWMRRMIDQHQARAEQTGARVVHACGFDSIPSDLGTWFTQQRAIEQFGEPCVEVRMSVPGAKGGVSGGTARERHEHVRGDGRRPGTPRDHRRPVRARSGRPASRARSSPGSAARHATIDSRVGSAPFVMAPTNSAVVLRSHALLGQPWGRDFTYGETMMTGDGTDRRESRPGR